MNTVNNTNPQNADNQKRKKTNHASSNLSLCLLNARSVRNKSASICDYVIDCKADVFAVTETWLGLDDAAVCKEITPTGYRMFHSPRKERMGGGTALLYKENLYVRQLAYGEKSSFEFSEYLINAISQQFKLIIIYRPPYSTAHPVSMSTFLDEFSKYLESIVLSKAPICICGDFNIHIDDNTNTDATSFKDLLESMCLFQHVKQPTHLMGHILDLIITRKSDEVVTGQPTTDRFISDHCSILCDLQTSSTPPRSRYVSSRKLKSIDLTSFKNDIAQSALVSSRTGSDSNGLAELYHNSLSVIIDRHAPITSRKISNRPAIPWMNADIIKAKRQRRKAERK